MVSKWYSGVVQRAFGTDRGRDHVTKYPQSSTSRVSEGTRTPDRLDHNQELYQLSYAHRGPFNLPASGRNAKAVRAP